MVWPKAAIAAGAFWNYDDSLSDADLVTVAAAAVARLELSNLDACPTDCDCDELSRCGSPYLTASAPAAGWT